MNAPELTYPCLVGHEIVELTAKQRDALAWEVLSPPAKIDILLQRIQALESNHKAMAKLIAEQAAALQAFSRNARRSAIESELLGLGYRMAPSLSQLDEEGAAIVEVTTGEMADESGLPPRVIELATEWSTLSASRGAND